MAPSKSRRGWVLMVPALLVGSVAIASVIRSKNDVRQDLAPTIMEELPPDAEESSPRTRQSSIAEVLQLADEALASMDESLQDYTARFVKQDRSESGALNERSEMDVKIQTRHRNETNDAPIRIYLKFHAPEATAGREVIWGKDLY